jgi:tRNA A37 threonylcarbamoyladenosine synthetase subunit TsaC/SUA5/YrdC
MTTEIVKLNSKTIPIIRNHLEQDQIVLIGIATTYVLVVNGNSFRAVSKLRSFKQFDKDQPLGILTRGDRAGEVVKLTPPAKIMLSHFPLAVTMIVEALPQLDPAITLGFRNLFIACPDQFTYDLVGAIPFPLISATAKVGGEPITSFEAAQKYFRGQVSLIGDGGRCLHGRRGTLVDFTLPVPTIMNFGPISVDDLRPLLPEIILPSHLMK